MRLPGMGEWSFSEWSQKVRSSRKLILAIVFLGLLLDNILLTVVVPIIPDYLMQLEQEEEYGMVDLWNDTALNMSHLWLNLTPPAGVNWTYKGWGVFQLTPEAAINENSEVGWLLSSKAILQLVCNPIIGPLTNRYGTNLPMFVGLIVLLFSTTLYAFGESYAVLFIARAIQGLGSACIAIAGLSMLAAAYPDDKERSRAMGIALGGIALGVLIGYPYGGFMYQFVGKTVPFLIIGMVVIIQAILVLWVLQPNFKVQSYVTGTPLHVLLADPYILLASGAILFPEMAMAMLEPTLPIWLMDTMHAEKWQLGTVFLPDSIGYLIGTNAFGVVAHKIGRWICTIASLALMGVCLICIPFATKIPHLIMPHFGLGLSLGIADVSIMPMMALLVDTRHVAVYGSVYAIAQVSISLGFAIGPSLGGQIVKQVGFPWLIRGMAVANLVYMPLCYFLRDPPTKDENRSILMDDQCQSYTNEENFDYHKLDEE